MRRFRPRAERVAFAEPAAIREVQTALLREHLRYAAERSPFYREAWRVAGLTTRGIEEFSLDRLGTLPTTSKRDLEARNDDFLAVPASEVRDIVMSSGTTGMPTRIMYTEGDLDRLSYNEWLSFEACGVTSEDTTLLTCTLDRCFIAGLAYFLGMRRLGAASIRNGHGTIESHLEVIRRMRPTFLVGVPGFLRRLGRYLDSQGYPAARAGVRGLVCIGEPLRDRSLRPLPLGADLERIWGAPAFSTYASSETVSSFCECTVRQGGHLHPELAVAEILNPSGRPVPEGEVGEVVVTPLQVEGMPLVRFRTGDTSFLSSEPCPCGRRTPRLGPVLGRLQQMMKVRGTTLFPQAVFAILDDIRQVEEYWVEARQAVELSDELIVHCAVAEGTQAGEIGRRLQAGLRVSPQVVIEPLESVRKVVYPAASRKPVRFLDRRRRSDELSPPGR
jgi:phenylacetate-CoA ligase